MGDRIFTADRLPLLDPETKQKPDKLSETYGDLCLMANGFAQVYPEHKYLIVECLRELHYTVGMTGDGKSQAAKCIHSVYARADTISHSFILPHAL
jgi:H+-transporting ATPase